MVKRFACIFTCLRSRAVHIAVVPTLSTDSLIDALRRLIGRRGKPEIVCSDSGTNFAGAERVLREELQRFNSQSIHSQLRQRGIAWKFNPPTASHMGGVWERLIRSVRKILSALLSEQSLTDEGLATLMVEVEAILNSRPLTPVTFDPKDDDPLTPNHLLLQTGSATPAPGVFGKDDCYVRGSWRQIQWMADQFWRRWSREYLPALLSRKKWTIKRCNI